MNLLDERPVIVDGKDVCFFSWCGCSGELQAELTKFAAARVGGVKVFWLSFDR